MYLIEGGMESYTIDHLHLKKHMPKRVIRTKEMY
jgi:hypothetical protein